MKDLMVVFMVMIFSVQMITMTLFLFIAAAFNSGPRPVSTYQPMEILTARRKKAAAQAPAPAEHPIAA